MRETRGTREFQDIFFHPAVVVIHWFFPSSSFQILCLCFRKKKRTVCRNEKDFFCNLFVSFEEEEERMQQQPPVFFVFPEYMIFLHCKTAATLSPISPKFS